MSALGSLDRSAKHSLMRLTGSVAKVNDTALQLFKVNRKYVKKDKKVNLEECLEVTQQAEAHIIKQMFAYSKYCSDHRLQQSVASQNIYNYLFSNNFKAITAKTIARYIRFGDWLREHLDEIIDMRYVVRSYRDVLVMMNTWDDIVQKWQTEKKKGKFKIVERRVDQSVLKKKKVAEEVDENDEPDDVDEPEEAEGDHVDEPEEAEGDDVDEPEEAEGDDVDDDADEPEETDEPVKKNKKRQQEDEPEEPAPSKKAARNEPVSRNEPARKESSAPPPPLSHSPPRSSPRRSQPATEAPVVERPAPVVQRPAPVVERHAPVVQRPAPVVERPAPVVQRPAPVVRPARSLRGILPEEVPSTTLPSVPAMAPKPSEPIAVPAVAPKSSEPIAARKPSMPEPMRRTRPEVIDVDMEEKAAAPAPAQAPVSAPTTIPARSPVAAPAVLTASVPTTSAPVAPAPTSAPSKPQVSTRCDPIVSESKDNDDEVEQPEVEQSQQPQQPKQVQQAQESKQVQQAQESKQVAVSLSKASEPLKLGTFEADENIIRIVIPVDTKFLSYVPASWEFDDIESSRVYECTERELNVMNARGHVVKGNGNRMVKVNVLTWRR